MLWLMESHLSWPPLMHVLAMSPRCGCRHEAQQLHEVRSQVADLWAAVADVGQQAAASSASETVDAAPSAPQLDWTADLPAPAQQPINHTTSL